MTAFWSAIVNSAILSSVLTIAVWIVLHLTPRRGLNAATRYAILWIVLLATVALPLTCVRWTSHISAPATYQAIPPTDPGPARPVATPATATRAALPIEIPASPWLRPMLLTWIAAALLLLLRVALSYAALYRRTARAADAPPELRARTRIALSEEIAIPMAVGPFRQSILIPTRLFATITKSDLDQIVLHEATHLARRDDYTLFLQRILEAIFPLHPVVRWITRQLDLEREIACDDAVARSSETARSYADCLTRMVQACGGVHSSLAASAFADSRSHLSRRVELLVCGNRTNSPRLRPRLFVLIAIALLCAAALLAKTPRLVAFAIPRPQVPAVAQLRTEVPPPPPVQEPIKIAQTTRRTPPPPPAPPEPPPPPPAPPQLPLYVLGANDVIGVSVYGQQEPSGTYRIAPDGRLSMPLIGTFSAAGLTIPDLKSLIAQKLEPFINAPVVNVQLLRNNSKKFTLIGAITRPGAYPLLQETTILEALASSGGFQDFANKEQILLRRGTKAFPFDYVDVIAGRHLEQNIRLEDGDIIIVPE